MGGATRRVATHLLCVLLLVLSFCGVYWHVIGALDTPRFVGCWDSWWLFGPNQVLIDHSIHNGELPLWNPLIFCGTPLAANPQVQLFYPPNLVRSLLTVSPTPLKTHIGFALLTAIHVLLAGYGMFCLARHHRLSSPASMVAAFAFMFSSGFVRRTITTPIWPMIVCWLPFLILLVRVAMKTDGTGLRLRLAAGAGLLYGMVVLGGNPQFFIYIALIVVCYVLFNCIPMPGRNRATQGDASPPSRYDGLRRATLVLGSLFAIAVLTAAPLLFSAQQFGALSTRAMGSGYVEHFEGDHSISPHDMLESVLVLPRTTENARITGAGVIVAVLALVGMLSSFARSRTPVAGMGATTSAGTRGNGDSPSMRDALPYAFVFLVILDCGLGPPFPVSTLLDHASPFSFSSPMYAWLFLAFPLGMLAAFGIDAVTRSSGQATHKAATTIAIAAAFLGAIAVVARSESAILPPRAENLAIPGVALVAVVLALRLPKARLWAPLLAALVIADLLTWHARFVPYLFSPRANLIQSPEHPFTGSLEELRETPVFWDDNRRGVEAFPACNKAMYKLRAAINGNDPLQIASTYDTLVHPALEATYARAFAGESAAANHRWHLVFKRPFWLARHYVEGNLPPKDALFPSATTVFVTEATDLDVPRIERASLPNTGISKASVRTPLSDEHVADALDACRRGGPENATPLVFDLPAISLPPLHSSLVLPYTSDCEGQVEATAHDGATGARVPLATAQIRRGESTLEFPLPDFETLHARLTITFAQPEGRIRFHDCHALSDRNDEGGLIRILRRTANTVDLRVGPLPSHRILLLTDAMYPGWHVEVDGHPGDLLLADNGFKAVQLGPGVHEVSFRFRSVRVYAGIVLSLTTIAAALGFILLGAVWNASATPRQPNVAECTAE
ncbi:MAG: YfhO family protein [bacterium]|nr:YfhO family protein [bacterium]